MKGASPGRVRARNVGVGLLAVAAVAAAVVWYGVRMGWWEERRLVLATVQDASKLELGAPVYFRGLKIGEVTMIRPPSAELPGYKLRMAVEQTAFLHIPLDSPVRIDPPRLNLPAQVTILPGLDPPDWDYPGKVKPLREVTASEDTVRMIKDVLEGMAGAAQAQAAQSNVRELAGEVKKLRAQVGKLQQEQSNKHAGRGE